VETEVVGRDVELETLERWLGDRDPSALLLEGEAGIGKTTLWEAGVARAQERGFRVLSTAAAGIEAQLSHTGLRDLLGTAYDEVGEELPEPQRHALGVVLLREEPRGPPPDHGTIGVVVLSSLRALADRGPALLAIDDVQWLDEASLGPLRYALRRLEPGLVPILLSRRSGHAEAPPLVEPDGLRVVHVGPLSVGALGHILHGQGTTYPRPTLHRINEISGGNPFYALELARALGHAPPLEPGAPLPVPSSLHLLVDERLATLPPETFAALAMASALSRPTLDVLAAALGGDPRAALGTPSAGRVVRLEGDVVRFAHPLYAAAVYDLTSDTRRAELHRLLADVVDDPEERARHLALATFEPDEQIASELEHGAASAFSRGSPSAAAELAGKARLLTPAGEHERAARRSLAEIDYWFAAGHLEQAASLLDQLLDETGPGAGRARLLSRQARLLHFGQDIATSVQLLREALAEARGDAALRGEIEEGLAWGLLLIRADLEAATAHAHSAARLAEERDDAASLAESLAVAALTELVLGREWRPAMERALALEHATLHLRTLRQPTFAYGYCLSCSDDLDAARECFVELQRRAADTGDEGSVPSILNHLTLIECLSDHWDRARAYAEEGFERALESGQRPTQAAILAKSALLAARRGDEATARDHATRALAIAGHVDFDAARPRDLMARGGETAIWALGFLELSLGRPEEAHRLLGPMCGALLEAGVAEPGEIRCLPDAIEALVASDRLEEAQALVDRLLRWSERLQRPSVTAVSLRCSGLLLERRDGPEAGLAVLEAAAEAHERVAMPFEHARTLIALGSALRRARHRKAARDTLGRALAVFDELGAGLWAARAREELGRVGGRAPSPGGLTPTEQRVAGLVAQGKSNKEVAAELVVSVHTVESALTSIYRKLDVRSRTELARRLPSEPGVIQ
jgi:DNA-binding CsgD family transcriptional regulator